MVNIKTSKERKEEKDKKTAEEKAKAEAAHKQRLDDNADGTGLRQKAATAGLAGEKLSQQVSDMKKTQKESVVNLKGVAGVFEGKKTGNLGINLNNWVFCKISHLLFGPSQTILLALPRQWG